jgi:hypothetical protein
VSLGFPTGVAPAVYYVPTWSFLGQRLHVGLGARFFSYLGGDGVAYPGGSAVTPAGGRPALAVDDPRIHALNLMASVSARIYAGLEAGVNIDLVGVGFGPEVTGRYAGADPALAGPQRARPARFNLLLFGSGDRGQLDSEFYLAYWFGRWGVRAGVSHMSTEYLTARRLDGGNDRFRAAATRFFLAAGFRP